MVAKVVAVEAEVEAKVNISVLILVIAGLTLSGCSKGVDLFGAEPATSLSTGDPNETDIAIMERLEDLEALVQTQQEQIQELFDIVNGGEEALTSGGSFGANQGTLVERLEFVEAKLRFLEVYGDDQEGAIVIDGADLIIRGGRLSEEQD